MGAPEPHGTAVAEIVHEMAPGAQLYLICIDTRGRPQDTPRTYAKTNGITIVNHSVGWFNSGRGDGSGGAGDTGRHRRRRPRQRHPLGQLGRQLGAAALERHLLGPGREPRSTTSPPETRETRSSSAVDQRRLRLPEVGRVADHEPGLRPVLRAESPIWRARRRHLTTTKADRQPPVEGACYQNVSGIAQYFFFAIQRFAGIDCAALRSLRRHRQCARVPQRRREHGRASDVTECFRRRRDLLERQRPRAVQLARPDDRRSRQAGHRRPGSRHLCRLRRFQRLRLLRLYGDVGRRAACGRRRRALEGSDPVLRRATGSGA